MKTVYLPLKNDWDRSGIDITWTKSDQNLSISGWYDTCVGIEGEVLTLKKFFDLLGITKKDCEKAFKDEDSQIIKEKL